MRPMMLAILAQLLAASLAAGSSSHAPIESRKPVQNTTQTGFAARPPEWKRYHSRYHTSSSELAEIAARAKPRLLVLYHQLFWGTSEDELSNEVRAGYAGKVVSGHDPDVF